MGYPLRLRNFSFLASVALAAAYSSGTSAADQNGYIAKYECRAGGPYCNVNVSELTLATCDQVVTTRDGDWSKINNNAQSRVFCVEAGDHSSKGTLTLGFSGTAQVRKVLRYYSSSDVGLDPWRLSESNRATVSKLRVEGSYWIIARLSVDGRGGDGDGVFIRAGANSNIMHRVLIQRHHGYQFIGDWNGTNANNVVQNSVIRNAVLDRAFEAECMDVQKAHNMAVVNNEIYNCHKAFSVGSGVQDVRGLLVENNDFYIGTDFYTDCSGNFNGRGPCSGSEAVMSIKTAGIAGNPAIFRQNRIWGGRPGDSNLIGSDNAGLGTGISISGNMPGNSSANYLLFANNVVMDSQSAITGWWGPDQNISVIGNIVYNIRAFKPDTASNALEINSKQFSEYYLNTIIDTDRWIAMGGTSNSGGASSYNDIRCNVVINGGKAAVQLGSNNQFDFNVFFNTTPFSTADAAKTLVFGRAEDAVSNEYCFYRKLRTGPERTCIPHARPSTSSPHYASCDTRLGTRLGVGISDEGLF